jgi:hypothetical protein
MEDTNLEIYKVVAEHILEDEFTMAQNTYFDKHKGSFEDTEENKLEYT